MINVMIMDNDILNIEVLEKAIKGYKDFNIVKKKKNSKNLIKELSSKKIDLLIIGLYSDDTDNFPLLKKIKEIELSGDLFVDIIITTSSKRKSDIIQALKFGVIDYLEKPFDISRFNLSLEKYKKKKEIINLNKFFLNQSDVDKIYNSTFSVSKELPKGINIQTLNKIKKLLSKDIEKVWSVNEVAKNIESSSVTVKKYLNYLESLEELESYTLYGKIGRPEVKYKLVNSILL